MGWQRPLISPRLVPQKRRSWWEGEGRPEEPSLFLLQFPPYLSNFYSFLKTCFKCHLLYETFLLQVREPS